MRYSFDITIPKNTQFIQPYEDRIRLDTGLLTQIMIGFKAGCNNLVHIAIFDSLEQIAPANGSLSLYANDKIVVIPMQYDLTTKPYELIIKGWSDGTRYEHVITFYFDIVETAQKEKGGLIQSIQHLLGGEL